MVDPRPRRPRVTRLAGASNETRARVARAAIWFAQGKTLAAIAAELGRTAQQVGTWQTTYRAIWAAAYDQAMEKIAAAVRTAAGSDRMMQDVDAWLVMAGRADDWARERGAELFPPPDDQQTLGSFFAGYYRTACLPPRPGPRYVEYPECAVRTWRLLTGDPPLNQIDALTLARFRDALIRRRGPRRHLPLSPFTINRFLKAVMTILAKAGPPAPRNWDAAGVLARVPRIRLLPAVLPERTIISEQQFADCYAAPVGMEQPALMAIRPALWWQTVLLLLWNTGIRYGTMIRLCWSHVDFAEACLRLPAEILKARRPLVVPIGARLMEHLKAIRRGTAHGTVLAMSAKNTTAFCKRLHRLQDLAGIPKAQHFTSHTFRRTFATRLFEVNPAAAVLALGHSAEVITRTHYVRPDQIIIRAIRQLHEPNLELADA